MLAANLITERYDGLSRGHRRLADFILASPHEAAMMTQEQVSKATGISKATANRLGRKLGLGGYPELQHMLRMDMKEALRAVESFTDTLAPKNLSRSTPWAQSIEEDLARIRGVAAMGGNGAFLRGSSLIAGARRVYFAGFGSSAFIAQYGSFCLSSLRAGSEAVTDSSGIEGVDRKILDATSEDVAIIFGFARYSASAIRLVRQFASLSVPIIAITDDKASPFAELAAVCFHLERKSAFVLSGSGAGGVAVLEALLRGTAASLGRETIMRRSARLTSLLGDSVVSPDD